MEKKAEIVTMSCVLTFISYLNGVHPLYQFTPTYWHHIKTPRTDNFCIAQGNLISNPTNVSLLECVVKCHLESNNLCVTFTYYGSLKRCQLYSTYAVGFEPNSICLSYQNLEPPTSDADNHALGKRVYANGNCTVANSGGSETLTDGLTAAGCCPCVSLSSQQPKWFVVDLARSVEVHSVSVTTAGTLGAKVGYFIIGVTTTFDMGEWSQLGIGPYRLCGQYPKTTANSAVYMVPCQRSLGGAQFVALIQNVTYTSFYVCELEVYGKYIT